MTGITLSFPRENNPQRAIGGATDSQSVLGLHHCKDFNTQSRHRAGKSWKPKALRTNLRPMTKAGVWSQSWGVATVGTEENPKTC